MVAIPPAAALATSPGDNGPIVFESFSDTDLEVWIMDPDGTNQDALTDNSVQDERPAISADA